MSCRICGQPLTSSRFDATFRDGGSEHLFFKLPGALCVPCKQFFIDPQLVEMIGMTNAHCTMAIETDAVLMAGRS